MKDVFETLNELLPDCAEVRIRKNVRSRLWSVTIFIHTVIGPAVDTRELSGEFIADKQAAAFEVVLSEMIQSIKELFDKHKMDTTLTVTKI